MDVRVALALALLASSTHSPGGPAMAAPPAPATFALGRPFPLAVGQRARGPGVTVALLRLDRPGGGTATLTLGLRSRDDDDDDDSLTLPVAAGAVAAWSDMLVEVVSQKEGATLLRVWRPSETRRPLALGRPLRLFPGETAVGPDGLTLKLAGFGHKIRMDRTDLPFAEIEAARPGEKSSVRLMFDHAEQATATFGPYELRGRSRHPGPPHGSDRELTLEVVRAAKP